MAEPIAESPKGGFLMIEGPKNLAESIAPPIIDAEPLHTATNDADDIKADDIAETHDSRWRLPGYAPLAAGIALAVVLGALAGAAATASFVHQPEAPVTTDATRALQNSVAQLNSELASLKAGISATQRTAAAQFGKLAERLDRAEKAQVEPALRLAKLQESTDKLGHQQAQASAEAPDTTGSIAAKEDSKPPVVEGWRLRDYYAGRAVLQGRDGTLFEVGPGSNLPGLGRVEAIKRENGKVVVMTRNGIIAGSFEQRRPPYYLPYRY
jgi:hypothetical protein